MKLKVIGCSSAGNAFLLEQGGSTLLLDAGVSYKKILDALDYELDSLYGAVITHEHSDHVAAVKQLSKASIPMIMTKGTADAVSYGLRYFSYCRIQNTERIKGDPWTVMAFSIAHDAAEPVGFIVKHKDAKNIVCYMPDSGYSKYTPVGITDLIIECNYIDEKIDLLTDKKEPFNLQHYNRLKHSHMSLERCKRQIELMDKSKMGNIILTHLSDENSDEERMVREVSEAFNINTVAAHDGMEIEL